MDLLLVGYKQPIIINQHYGCLIHHHYGLFVCTQPASHPFRRSETARSAAALGRPGRPIQIRAESLHDQWPFQDPIDWRYRFHI
jgi:hypothetical protein